MKKFTVFTSEKNPFWTLPNINKPSFEVFNKWCIDNFKETEVKLNLPTIWAGQVILENENMKYFKITNGEVDYFYFVDSVFKNTEALTVYNLILDVYSTYTIKFIELNKKTNFTFLRSHYFNPEVATVGDTVLDSIVKPYSGIGFKKHKFMNSEDKNNNKYYWNTDFALVNPENNAYKYYVFSDGPNGSYTVFPCINNKEDITFITKGYKKGAQIYNASFRNMRDWRDMHGTWTAFDVPAEMNTKLDEAYKNGDFVEFYYTGIRDNINWAEQTNEMLIPKVPIWTYPVDIHFDGGLWEQSWGFFKANMALHLNGSAFYHGSCDGITTGFGFLERSIQAFKDCAWFRVKIFQKEEMATPPRQTYKNSKQSLDDILTRVPEWGNKFLGIFAGPNLLNFEWNNFGSVDIDRKKFLYFNLPADGLAIQQFPILDYNLRMKNGLNNIEMGHHYNLKFLNVNYFNNNINAFARFSNQNKIFLSGKLIFSNGFHLLDKSSSLLPLSQSLISFGGQLPTAKDLYNNYINSQMNTRNTGIEIKRQENSIATLKGGMDFGVNSASSLMGFAGASKAASLFNITNADAISSGKKQAQGGPSKGGLAGGILQNAGNFIGGIFDRERGLANERKMMLAGFEDANNSMGNVISIGSTLDASNSVYFESEGEQFDGCEVIELSKASNILINNYLLLNGYFYPHNLKIEEFLTNARDFSYLQIDDLRLSINSNLAIPENFTNEILSLVQTHLTNGLRIWNKDETKILDCFVDDVKDENPYFHSGPIPPPNIEIPPVPEAPQIIDIYEIFGEFENYYVDVTLKDIDVGRIEYVCLNNTVVREFEIGRPIHFINSNPDKKQRTQLTFRGDTRSSTMDEQHLDFVITNITVSSDLTSDMAFRAKDPLKRFEEINPKNGESLLIKTSPGIFRIEYQGSNNKFGIGGVVPYGIKFPDNTIDITNWVDNLYVINNELGDYDNDKFIINQPGAKLEVIGNVANVNGKIYTRGEYVI